MPHTDRVEIKRLQGICSKQASDNARLRAALIRIASGAILLLPLPENFGAFYHTALDQRDIARKVITDLED